MVKIFCNVYKTARQAETKRSEVTALTLFTAAVFW
jgi:hypothetical protein